MDTYPLNYNFNGCNYFYVIFESGKKGYILKEEFLPPKFDNEQKNAFFDFTEFIGEKFYNGYSEQKLLEEIGYISDYKLNSHKEEIVRHTQGLCTALGVSKAENRENIMYLIMTINKIEDFSKVPRYDESRYAIFLNFIRHSYGDEKLAEFYLN